MAGDLTSGAESYVLWRISRLAYYGLEQPRSHGRLQGPTPAQTLYDALGIDTLPGLDGPTAQEALPA